MNLRAHGLTGLFAAALAASGAGFLSSAGASAPPSAPAAAPGQGDGPAARLPTSPQQTWLLFALLVGVILIRFVWNRRVFAIYERALAEGRSDVLREIRRSRRDRALYLGLMLFAAGVGLLAAHYLQLLKNEHSAGGAGIIFALTGLALLLFQWLIRE